jgi:hypothetical protein
MQKRTGTGNDWGNVIEWSGKEKLERSSLNKNLAK